MTVLDHRPATQPPVRWLGVPRLLAGTAVGTVDLARHRSLHGGLALPTRAELRLAVSLARLRGRGGAAFPVFRKLDSLPDDGAHAVVVNGSESEPASHKDRVLMRLAPHLVLDGALGVAHAVGAARVVVAVHDEAAGRALAAAVADRADAARVEVVRSGGSFVSGEARALLTGLSGAPALPDGRRTLPTAHGLDARPTFVSNAETFAQIGLLLTEGVDAHLATGTPGEPGTTLVTLLGDVDAPGVVEVPHGMALSDLLGHERTPVLVGGYHGSWVAGAGAAVLDRDALTAAGTPWGAGVLARLGADTCALGEVHRVVAWLAAQSAGQCGPCVFGLPAVADAVGDVVRGGGQPAVDRVGLLVGAVDGRGACAHPDGTARFVRSALRTLAGEVAVHATHGGCGRPVLGRLPLGGAR
ncbi:NADH-ubiquinone oxidoreductase-F iron-sulfur binding region domain-containing protein [Solicola sp. PLA-1-18]|uniref:NADH-ubiquinone oxidoreductase-F iron-sulfur binding region domain-containing protein n=1 Tax=Solicola sp. PLA-1-18 TaxID=3380532 RepID=UPI003B7EFA61